MPADARVDFRRSADIGRRPFSPASWLQVRWRAPGMWPGRWSISASPRYSSGVRVSSSIAPAGVAASARDARISGLICGVKVLGWVGTGRYRTSRPWSFQWSYRRSRMWTSARPRYSRIQACIAALRPSWPSYSTGVMSSPRPAAAKTFAISSGGSRRPCGFCSFFSGTLTAPRRWPIR